MALTHRRFLVKRSEALRSLSRDHHQSLAIAQRLRRADADEVDTASRDFLNFWRTEGEEHFRIEEEVLLPHWALLGELSEEAVARLVREHLEIRTAVLTLESEPDLDHLHRLGELLAGHVRFEERELFPLIEADLSGERLRRLASVVGEAEVQQG